MTALSRPRGNRALFALLALFLAGFFAIVGVSWLIAGMLDDLERHRGNEQARLFVGEHITTTVRDIEGKTYKEIAAVLDITEDQVKVNIFRARQTIKQQFQKYDNYGL